MASSLADPRITIYGKLIDNNTQEVLRDYVNWDPNLIWYYGRVNGIKGGESPYVIEFDIWNNEPAFNGLSGTQAVADAENCRLSVWNDSTLKDSSSMQYAGNQFMQIRCITNGFYDTFKPCCGPLMYNSIYGNVEPDNVGIIKGQLGGDHAIIQTKIVLPDTTTTTNQPPLTAGTVNFVFAFYYDYE